MTCTNQTDVSAYPWKRWEKITFDQSFVSKHQTFSFENCCLGKKRRSKVVGTFHKFWGWGTETFSEQSKAQTSHGMTLTHTIPGSFCGKGITVQCGNLLFNVAPLDSS